MFARHHFRFERHETHSRLFEKGDLKYVVLELLKDKSHHGYEIMRAIEDRFMGFYSPSAGSIYPTLQLLEDMGYVKAVEQDGKKVYSITEEGKTFLKQREETVDRIKSNMRAWWGDKNREDMRHAVFELMSTLHGIRRKSQLLDPEKQRKMQEILSRAIADIKALNI